MAKIIDGKKIAQLIKDEVKAGVLVMQKEKGITPGLAVVLIGEDPASQVYVAHKQKACIYTGIHSFEYNLHKDESEKDVLALIDKLNRDDRVHGILVQLPLPKHVDASKVLRAIDPRKDVDGFHPVNVGAMLIGEPAFTPCTPAGIIELLKRSHIEIAGKHAVVVGRSNIVGKPVSFLLQKENATVTMCHSKTEFLSHHTNQSDILVAAIGKPEFVKADMVKEGVVVIDVGVNRLSDGKLAGDVYFKEVEKKALAITPVPGGVGPMTIAMLMKNCLKAASGEDYI